MALVLPPLTGASVHGGPIPRHGAPRTADPTRFHTRTHTSRGPFPAGRVASPPSVSQLPPLATLLPPNSRATRRLTLAVAADVREDEPRGGSTQEDGGDARPGARRSRFDSSASGFGGSAGTPESIHGRWTLGESRATGDKEQENFIVSRKHDELAGVGFTSEAAEIVSSRGGDVLGDPDMPARETADGVFRGVHCHRKRRCDAIDLELMEPDDIGFINSFSIDSGYEHGEFEASTKIQSNARAILGARRTYGPLRDVRSRSDKLGPLPRVAGVGEGITVLSEPNFCTHQRNSDSLAGGGFCNLSSDEIECDNMEICGEIAGTPPLRNRGVCSSDELNFQTARAPARRVARKGEFQFVDRHVNGRSRKGAGSRCTDVEDETAVQSFYGQLWDDGDTLRSRVSPTTSTPSSLLVWINKVLVRGKAFAAADCFQISPQEDHLPPTSEISLSSGDWNCCPRPTIVKILECWDMADRGKAKAKGRGGGSGRGNQWVRSQQLPPFDYFQQQGIPPAIQPQPPQQPYPPFPPYGFPPWQPFPGQFPPPFQGNFPAQWQQQPPQHGNWQNQAAKANPRAAQQNKKQQPAKGKEDTGTSAAATNQMPGGALGAVTAAAVSDKDKGEVYAEVICYNCGEPGHHKAACTQPPSCFICGSAEHEVEGCPVKKEPQALAKFIGSAASGLGFYHIELSEQPGEKNTTKNVGLVYIDAGSATKEDIYQGLATIYKTNWPWQIRELDEWTFLVKFPPHIKVEEVAGYPSFGLPKEGVFVKVHVWKGGLDYFADLEEIWLQLRGLDPLWCKWKTLVQFVTAFGLVQEVDWFGMFKSFYEVVRVKIKCRDHTKIPAVRLFEVQDQLYQIKITVEGPATSNLILEEGTDGSIHPPSPGDHEDQQDGGGGNTEKGQDVMDTDKANPQSAAKNSSGNGASAGGSATGTKTAAVTSLSDKVHEIAAAYAEKRDMLACSSLLSPIQEDMSARERVMEWIKEGGIDDSTCTNLMQQMELDQEEEFFYEDPDRDMEPAEEDVEESKQSKWGPICGTRQSSRFHNAGGLSMLQLAQNVMKKKNLEEPATAASKLKGLEKDFVFFEEVDTDLQGGHAASNRGILYADSVDSQGADAAGEWVIAGLPVSRRTLDKGTEAQDAVSPRKKMAVQGTWTTPTSTLEQAFISPVA